MSRATAEKHFLGDVLCDRLPEILEEIPLSVKRMSWA
jgi:hypothetical protein